MEGIFTLKLGLIRAYYNGSVSREVSGVPWCAQLHVDWDLQMKCAWIQAYTPFHTSGLFCTCTDRSSGVHRVSVGKPQKTLYTRLQMLTF